MKDNKAVRYLTIMEISQKQAYIFASKQLRKNINNSATIAGLMNAGYFEYLARYENEKNHNEAIHFSADENLVYSGGGHIILEFDTNEHAISFTKLFTRSVHQIYPDIEIFTKTVPYNTNSTPGENIQFLTSELERKKAERKAVFHQGSFGIEKVDTDTMKTVRIGQKSRLKEESEKVIHEIEKEVEKLLKPKKYKVVDKFSELGGTVGESAFIAVVHIDGNAMGKRVKEFDKRHEKDSWEEYKKAIYKFSESIDKDFKSAYRSMVNTVEKNLETGKLKNLNLSDGNFPVRRVITAGDDICFVTEGRIGIECAVAFIKALADLKDGCKNEEDGNGYSACAGVAIVHRKYPFYKAYELAEKLCDNAKKFGAELDILDDHSGKNVSCIDWHLDFGEIGDTLSEIRSEYIANDGIHMELRPYIVVAAKDILKNENYRQYEKFKKLITKIQMKDICYAKGKLKELRGAIKQGENATKQYLIFNRIDDIGLEAYQGVYTDIDISGIGEGKKSERKILAEVSVEGQDGTKNIEKHSLLFDAIELLDTFMILE